MREKLIEGRWGMSDSNDKKLIENGIVKCILEQVLENSDITNSNRKKREW